MSKKKAQAMLEYLLILPVILFLFLGISSLLLDVLRLRTAEYILYRTARAELPYTHHYNKHGEKKVLGKKLSFEIKSTPQRVKIEGVLKNSNTITGRLFKQNQFFKSSKLEVVLEK